MAQWDPQELGRYQWLGAAVVFGLVEEVVAIFAAGGVDIDRPIPVSQLPTSAKGSLPPILLLSSAPIEQQHRLLTLLLRHGADPNVRDEEGITPLYRAAMSTDYGMVAELLKAGADPNWPLATVSRSALGLGLELQWSEEVNRPPTQKGPLVSLLLAYGADPNGPVRKGAQLRPIHLAADLLHVEAMMALLAAGADPDPPVLPITPLWRIFSRLLRLDQYACPNPIDIIGIISMMLAAGARPDPLFEPPAGYTPLLPSLIAFCSHSSPLARMIIKCLTLVIVAARHDLHLLRKYSDALCGLLHTYLTEFTLSQPEDLLSNGSNSVHRLIQYALRISPLCYGKRLI